MLDEKVKLDFRNMSEESVRREKEKHARAQGRGKVHHENFLRLNKKDVKDIEQLSTLWGSDVD